MYAPVIIPTLNRYDHFKLCLESLESCVDADKTDVYVALDYPPSDNYVEGWKKIDDYLRLKELHNGFKSLYVTRRDHNYGVCNENANDTVLIREIIRPKYPCYIYTEDDNVFSPCFLDYMNKALEMFKDDTRITSVTGYSWPNIKKPTHNNVYFSYTVSGWGYGLWFGKQNNESLNVIIKKIMNPFLALKFCIKAYPSVLLLMDMLKWGKMYGDIIETTFNIFNNFYQLAPCTPLVRNNGFDGSGLHCPNVSTLQFHQDISNSNRFVLDIKRPIKTPPYNFLKFVKDVYHLFVFIPKYIEFRKYIRLKYCEMNKI